MKFYTTVLILILFAIGSIFLFSTSKKQSIKIGILTSQTGTMSANEKPISDMLKSAVEAINKEGGIKNHKIEILEFDGKSDAAEFKKGANALLDQGAVALFGCWTSASRKEVKEVVEKRQSILFYPLQYEGFESSPNIIYLGLSANQQINPTIDFISTNFGENIYLIGSNYIYPKAANLYINELAKLTKLNVVGERYFSLAETDFGNLFEELKAKKPNAIINTLNGDTNRAFFKQLKESGLDASSLPVFSLSVDENSLEDLSKDDNGSSMLAHYATWGYFDSMRSNHDELSSLFGKHQKTKITDAMFSAYLGIEFFKQAVLKSKNIDSLEILRNLKRTSVAIGELIFYVDAKNSHVHRNVFIGKVTPQNQFQSVWQTSGIVTPKPYPSFKERSFWDERVDEIYKSFGNRWEQKDEL